MNPPRVPWLSLFVGPLLAAGLYGITVQGTFLSDDFLMNAVLTRDATPAVNWAEILADFGRSWAGGEGSALYRPLVSLSIGACYALFGHAPMGFHAFNVALHVLAAFACALLCGRLARETPGRAAALGGAVFALHPVAAEPVCWIASRTTGLQVMFAAIALASCVGYLQSRSRRHGVTALACLVAGMMCKESAVVLPPSFVLLDVLQRRRGTHPFAWRFHRWSFGILAAYFGLRLALFGALVGGSTAEQLHGDPLRNLLSKFEMLVMPVGLSLPAPWGTVAGAVTATGTGLLLLAGLRRRGLWILGGFAWATLFFVPTYKLAADAGTLVGSRMVYGATLAFAVTLAVAANAPGPRLLRRGGVALLLLGLIVLATARVRSYVQSYGDMTALQQQLSEKTSRATPDQPIAFVSVNPRPVGIPFLNCNALFPLLEKPVTQTDIPSVSLGFTFQPVPDSEELLFDVGPMRAMRGQGAILVDWLQTQLVEWPPAPTNAALPTLTKREPGWFLAAQAVDPGAVEIVEVEVEGPCSGGRIEWLFTTDGDPQHATAYSEIKVPAVFQAAPRSAGFGQGTTRAGRTVFRIDVSHHVTFFAIGLLGQLAGIRVVTEGDGIPVAVRLENRLAPLDLPQELRGQARSIEAPDSPDWRAPALPAGGTSMNLYLVGPDTTLRTSVTPGAPVELPTRVRNAIRVILRTSRSRRYYFYFEAPGPRPARTEVDWLRFETSRDRSR